MIFRRRRSDVQRGRRRRRRRDGVEGQVMVNIMEPLGRKRSRRQVGGNRPQSMRHYSADLEPKYKTRKTITGLGLFFILTSTDSGISTGTGTGNIFVCSSIGREFCACID